MNLLKKVLGVGSALLIACTPMIASAQAASSMTVLDSTGATKTIACITDASSHLVCNFTPDTSGNPVSPATAPNQTSQITQETAIHTVLGAPGDAVCTSDTGSCSLNAQLQRAIQKLTSLISSLGSPLQAGGSVVASGGASNGSSGVAAGSVSVPSVAYNYVWNGTTWDQMQASTTQAVTQSGGPWTVTNVNTPSTATTASVAPSQSANAASSTLQAKTSAGNLYGYDCVSATASLKCIAYDNNGTPGASLTASKVLGCFDVTTGHAEHIYTIPRTAVAGVVILLSSGADCLTYTASSTGFLTAYVK